MALEEGDEPRPARIDAPLAEAYPNVRYLAYVPDDQGQPRLLGAHGTESDYIIAWSTDRRSEVSSVTVVRGRLDGAGTMTYEVEQRQLPQPIDASNAWGVGMHANGEIFQEIAGDGVPWGAARDLQALPLVQAQSGLRRPEGEEGVTAVHWRQLPLIGWQTDNNGDSYFQQADPQLAGLDPTFAPFGLREVVGPDGGRLFEAWDPQEDEPQLPMGPDGPNRSDWMPIDMPTPGARMLGGGEPLQPNERVVAMIDGNVAYPPTWRDRGYRRVTVITDQDRIINGTQMVYKLGGVGDPRRPGETWWWDDGRGYTISSYQFGSIAFGGHSAGMQLRASVLFPEHVEWWSLTTPPDRTGGQGDVPEGQANYHSLNAMAPFSQLPVAGVQDAFIGNEDVGAFVVRGPNGSYVYMAAFARPCYHLEPIDHDLTAHPQRSPRLPCEIYPY